MYCTNVLISLGLSFDVLSHRSAPGFVSNADYIFTKDGETRAVVEVNSPGVFKSLIQNLLTIHDAFELKMQTGATTTAENVINKVCPSYPHPWIRIYFSNPFYSCVCTWALIKQNGVYLHLMINGYFFDFTRRQTSSSHTSHSPLLKNSQTTPDHLEPSWVCF